LHDVWGIDVIPLKRVNDLYSALARAPSISATNLVDLYGIKYVISITPLEKGPDYELLYARIEGLPGKREDLIKGNTIKLYKKKEVHPRAWVVKEFRVLEAEEMLSVLKGKDFQPDKEVLLEEEPPHPIPLPQGGEGKIKNKMGDHSGSPLRVTKYVGEPPVPARCSASARKRGLPEFISETNNRMNLLVEMRENGLLVLSDTYYPGWKVYVDGEERKIYRANYTFRAVPLLPGTHRVEFVYDPLSFKVGSIITFLTIIGCFGIGWISRRRSHLPAGRQGGSPLQLIM